MTVALYRKYRPQNFDEMVGQRAVVTGLKNALEMKKWVHAYLFSGPRGSGKTTTARILAKALNCSQGNAPTPAPCGTCDNCLSIRDGRCMDVIEMDAASNRGIDEIRNLKESVAFQPSSCRFKVYIIDEAHMLTTPAFNALLKTIEEPPSDVVFVLCTTEAHKIPLTILSRCQRYDFTRLPMEDMFSLLNRVVQGEGYRVEEGVFDLVYAHSEGAARDALSLLEQLAIYSHNHITQQAFLELLGIPQKHFYLDLLSALSERNFSQILALSRKACEKGLSFWNFLNTLTSLLRDLLAIRQGIPPSDLYREEEQARLRAIAHNFSHADLFTLFDKLGHFRYVFKWETEGRLLWDIAFLTLFHSLTEEISSIPSKPEMKVEAPASTARKSTKEIEQSILGSRKIMINKIEGKPSESPPAKESTEPEQLFLKESSLSSGYVEQDTGKTYERDETSTSPTQKSRVSAEEVEKPEEEAISESTPEQSERVGGSPKAALELDWRGFYESLKVQSPVLAGLLSPAVVQELSPSRLVVSFPSSFTFPRIYLKKLSVRKELEERLKVFFQQDIAFRMVEGAKEGVRMPPASAPSASIPPGQESVLQTILHFFPGSEKE